jgi:hypothetical protein
VGFFQSVKQRGPEIFIFLLYGGLLFINAASSRFMLQPPLGSRAPRIPCPWWTEEFRDVFCARKRTVRYSHAYPMQKNLISFKHISAVAQLYV